MFNYWQKLFHVSEKSRTRIALVGFGIDAIFLRSPLALNYNFIGNDHNCPPYVIKIGYQNVNLIAL